MKVWHLAVAALVIGIAVAAFFISNSGLVFRGALQQTIPSQSYSVEAIGNNLRAYTFIDGAGRVCTGVYSDKGNSWGDCDFVPKGVELPNLTPATR